ncbi:FecR family protein [Seonamhaeicola marinus]|uniref:FecR family protein n=1 Tax=Seonamhaeicola marinus TaxID=1912246 RepID=A0A5D0HTZ2_9FLAO|nr:FecR family protein [Seonamhaeicola marinus]TYA74766.1 FecR family protein [Seonamhaeicola marinus]
MTGQDKFENIVTKFLSNEANIEELELLENYLKSPKNLQHFNRLVKIEYLTSITMAVYNKANAQNEINKKIKAIKKQKTSTIIKRFSVAASIILASAFGLGYIYFNKDQVEQHKIVSPPESNIIIKPGSEKATLTLANGNQVYLEKGENYTNDYVESNGKKLTYKEQGEQTKNTIEYNYLEIPRGGEYFVVLADGTKVWLNSESKLKYPTAFVKGLDRTIELLYGEAYFEVSPSTNHKGSHFYVLSKGQKIDVIGTEFNIKAYNDENSVYTTLVEGKIALEKGAFKKTLKPNQQAQIDLNTNTVNIVDVDTSQEIAWVKGLFSFEEAKLEDMMKTLSRWYNIEVLFEKSSLRAFKFTGILQREKKIEDLLKTIKTSSDDSIQFDIRNNIIIIR